MSSDEGYAPSHNLKRSRSNFSANVRSLKYEGPEGEESLVEVANSFGTVETYDGPKGQERMIRSVNADSTITHYKGDRGEEYMVKVVAPHRDNRTTYYEGGPGKEAMRRTVWPDGRVRYWAGERWQERKLRTTFAVGGMKVFTGPRSQERLAMTQFPDDTFVHYHGPKGEERAWLRVNKSGIAQIMDPHAQDRVLRSITTDGQTLYHHADSDRVTNVPQRKYQHLKSKISEAHSELQDLVHDNQCNQQAYLRLSELLQNIHNATEECFVAKPATVHGDSEEATMVSAEETAGESENEEEPTQVVPNNCPESDLEE